MTEILYDLGPCLKCLARSVVQDEIKITLAISNLLILEAEGKLVKARCQEHNILCEHTELASIPILRVGPAGVAYDTNPISSAKEVVVFGESGGIVGVRRMTLGFAEYL
jgi:predicted nucleic-acid-binding Zn-ribbon protein